MRIIYNNIELKVVKVLGWDRRAVYDKPANTDYLYTRHVLHVRAVFNPAATAYWMPAVPGSPVSFAFTPGEAPPTGFENEPVGYGPLTDKSLKHFLMLPRKQLFVYAEGGTVGGVPIPGPTPGVVSGGTPYDDVEVLVSPMRKPDTEDQYYTVDAKTGPTPLSCNVVSIHGMKTWIVDFAIETNLVECHLETSNPPMIISHRWTMESDLDQDFYTTRTVRGSAIFRMDLMLDAGVGPDDFRAYLFHPIPVNFRRMKPQVWMDEDGTRLHYVIVDREVASNVVAKGVSRIEAYQTIGQEWVGGEKAGLSIINAIGEASLLNPLSFVTKPLAATYHSCPILSTTVVAKVWGSRKSTRAGLVRVVQAILMARTSLFSGVLSSVNASITTDLMGRFAEGRASYVSGPLNTIVKFTLGHAFGDFKTRLPSGDDIVAPDGTSIAVTSDRANPKPPADTGTRGFFLTAIVAQVLGEACEQSASPVDAAYGTTTGFLRDAVPRRPG